MRKVKFLLGIGLTLLSIWQSLNKSLIPLSGWKLTVLSTAELPLV